MKIKEIKGTDTFIHGFTIIEMMVVVTIFAILGVAVATSFTSGIKIWQRAKDYNFTQTNVILSLEGITQHLRRSVDIDEIGFEGSSQEVIFPTLTADSVVRVSYRFDDGDKIIRRKEETLEEIISQEEEQTYKERDILSADNFSLEYLYFDEEKERYLWQDIWEKDKGVFRALRLKVEVEDTEFTKTVFVPIGE